MTPHLVGLGVWSRRRSLGGFVALAISFGVVLFAIPGFAQDVRTAANPLTDPDTARLAVVAERKPALPDIPRHTDPAVDPLTVQRAGAGWRYTRDGWIVLHIEGKPYDRGFQHGTLLAAEIVDYMETIGKARVHEHPEKGFASVRLLVDALFLRDYAAEYLEEMKGIADGANAAGAKFHDRRLDVLDIACLNCDAEVGYLESALKATPTGLERKTFREPQFSKPKVTAPDRCSAFVAHGPATADGKIVLGHITMSSLHFVRHFNVWIDIAPDRGHRIAFQGYPGGIQSGMDYYINSHGLVCAETTIGQTRFHRESIPLASRIRQAMQYANTIDDAVAILKEKNNGLYTNEWLFGDLRTNEIAMFELGTFRTKLWRSGREEWFANTPGFYWGCNNTKDLAVHLESITDLKGKPGNPVFNPHSRDRAWLSLYDQHKGRIDSEFGFLAFSTPPLAGYPSCDAKFTTSAMAERLESWALFGNPAGRTWDVTEADRKDFPSVKPLVINDWTLLTTRSPAAKASGSPTPADLKPFTQDDAEISLGYDDNHPAAWRGTLLPKTEADQWLAAAFAEYERVVSFEQALRRQSDDGKLKEAEEDLVESALFQHESRWGTAVRRMGAAPALTAVRPRFDSHFWYEYISGKGVMLLHALKGQLGEKKFVALMDDFGSTHGGEKISTGDFRAYLAQHGGDSAVTLLDAWLAESSTDATPVAANGARPAAAGSTRSDATATGAVANGAANAARGAALKHARGPAKSPWHIHSCEDEPEHCLIVYGTLRDAPAQREAALLLQRDLMRRFYNVAIPVRSDIEVRDADWADKHILLVGRPSTNRVTAKVASGLPIQFGTDSFRVRDAWFAHSASGVIVAGNHPHNPRYSVVVYAGLGADATQRVAQQPYTVSEIDPQVLLLTHGQSARKIVTTIPDTWGRESSPSATKK